MYVCMYGYGHPIFMPLVLETDDCKMAFNET